MLLQLLFESPITAIIIFGAIVISISIHEAAHAFSAIWLGDNTPKLQKRNTINPLKHLDPWGTLLIVLVGIGWGRPVEFNPYNLKKPRKDTMLIAFAGPLSNILLALSVAFVIGMLTRFGIDLISNPVVSIALSYIVYINIVLAIFNMFPIEPLDGFKVVNGLLPKNLVPQWQETRKYGFIVLIVFLITGAFGRILTPVVDFIMSFIERLF